MEDILFKPGDRVLIGPLKYKILSYDKKITEMLGEIHYECQLVNRRCKDFYPQSKMKKI